MNEFKYQYYFDKNNLTNCPPETYKAIDNNAYRYVFDDIENENNFKPVYLINPLRINSMEDMKLKCQGFGLSLYGRLEEAKKNYKSLIKRNKNFHKIVGNKIAEIQLRNTDGIGSEIDANTNTHFTFHEYVTANLIDNIIDILDMEAE